MIPAARAPEWLYAFSRNWLSLFAARGSTITDAMEPCCPVIELRQYTLRPGTRETLVRVFDEHFVEGQERHGMRIIGQFRDLDDPNRFVWLRGFADMEARTRALEAFYSGPVWTEYGPTANATMVDHTNVLLLRPITGTAGFRTDPHGPDIPGGMVVATIDHLRVPASPDVVAALRDENATGALAQLVTESAPNLYLRLPVREDANVFVTFTSHSTTGAYRPPKLSSPAVSRREHLRLQPTRRSFLRAIPPLPLGKRAGRGGHRMARRTT